MLYIIDNINPGYVCDRKWLKTVVWIWKILKRDVKKIKKSALFKEGKKQQGYLKDKKKLYNHVFLFFESIVVNYIKNVHNMSFFL